MEMRGGGGQGEDGLPNTNTRYSFRFDLRVTLAREVASACHARTRHHHFDRLAIKANKKLALHGSQDILVGLVKIPISVMYGLTVV